MDTLRVMVVEDHVLARERLVGLLQEHPGVEVVAACEHGLEAVERIPAVEPDLVFLDVQMPEMSGFDVIDAITVERMPPVVFVTAFDSYALRAFEVHAFDYLLKPFGRERLGRVVERARRGLPRRSETQTRLNALLGAPEVAGQRERLVVRSGGRVLFIRREEVEWVEADGNYARLHTSKGPLYVRERMTDLEQRLGPAFARIHRSSLVNLHGVLELQLVRGGDYDVVMRSGVRLRVTRLHRPTLEARLQRL
jgi:two-component system LytT family response regulator